MSFGIPLVTAGLTEDKADVNARVAWSGVGINLGTNEAAPAAVRAAVRTVLDTPAYRARAREMAAEFRSIDTRTEILRIVEQVVNADDLEQYDVAEGRTSRREPGANRFAQQPAMPSP
jgi:UDP:flavonoid glycosyltransferase YjiC (YdhE family)